MAPVKSTTVARIYKLLEPLLEIEDRKPTFDEVVDAIDTGLTEWRLGLSFELRKKATEWEEKMGDGDKTLYSLGLRHAIDLVTEYDPIEEDPNENRKFNDTI